MSVPGACSCRATETLSGVEFSPDWMSLEILELGVWCVVLVWKCG